MRIFLDTAPLIYLCEGTAAFSQAVSNQLEQWIRSEAILGTSTLTLLELLVVPKREKNERLATKYQALLADLLTDPPISLDETTAVKAADYRAAYGLKTPDAVQLATAVRHGYDLFYTNDRKLACCQDLEILLVADTRS